MVRIKFRVSLAVAIGALSGIVVTPQSFSQSDDVVSHTPFSWPRGSTETGLMVTVTGGKSPTPPSTNSIAPVAGSPRYLATFPVCDGSKFGNCVIGVEARTGQGTWQAADVAVRRLPTRDEEVCVNWIGNDGSTFQHKTGRIQQDISKGIPDGDTAAIWKVPNAPHSLGDNYLVSVSYRTFPEGTMDRKFSMSIIPVSYSQVPQRETYGSCTSSLNHVKEANFPKNIEFRLKIRLGVVAQEVSTFFSGRINTPQIELDGDVLTISGRPELEPLAQTQPLLYENLTADQKRTPSLSRMYGIFSSSGSPRGSTTFSVGDDLLEGQDAFKSFGIWESSLSEIGKNTSWSLESAGAPYDCSITGILGVVSSNSLIFSRRPPLWDPKTNSLTYQMASLSRDREGRQNLGNFDLVMRSDLIKCLWGFSPSPNQQVEVKITYGDGRIGASTSSFKVLPEWTYLNVSGYSFSAPLISVSLKSPVSPKTETRPAVQEKAVLKTITCSKKKLVKVVTASNPKCPKGFKKG